MNQLSIEQAGHVWVQDLGRPGFASIGVPASGASDQYAARIANVLVGNQDSAPLIELVGSTLIVRSDCDALIAVTGSADRVDLAGSPNPAWELLAVPAHTQVRVPIASTGLRSYLAINGVLRAPKMLGSAAPDPLLNFATTLSTGDILEFKSRFVSHPGGSPHHLFRLGAHRPDPSVGGITNVSVTPGPDLDRVLPGPDCLETQFTVSQQSDHVGIRLDGPPIELAPGEEILSRGVPVGAVELPSSESVIVLLRARLLTAGYPVVAVATTSAIDALGQLRPGDSLRFQFTSMSDALSELHCRESEYRALARRVRDALAARGLGGVIDIAHGATPPLEEAQ